MPEESHPSCTRIGLKSSTTKSTASGTAPAASMMGTDQVQATFSLFQNIILSVPFTMVKMEAPTIALLQAVLPTAVAKPAGAA